MSKPKKPRKATTRIRLTAAEKRANIRDREIANAVFEKTADLRKEIEALKSEAQHKHMQYVEARAHMDAAVLEARALKNQLEKPVPMRLVCPECGTLHVDEGWEGADKPHHTHVCQHCGNVWRPAVVATVGVIFLPGFKNEVAPAAPPAPPPKWLKYAGMAAAAGAAAFLGASLAKSGGGDAPARPPLAVPFGYSLGLGRMGG